jgi:hypothetical protein
MKTKNINFLYTGLALLIAISLLLPATGISQVSASPQIQESDPPEAELITRVLGEPPPVNTDPKPEQEPNEAKPFSENIELEPEKLPDVQEQEYEGEVRAASWQVLRYEGFEGVFPSTGWSTHHSVGAANTCWDDESYKPYNGNWSAWAAGGCTGGLDPATSYYANNMDSWMVYGPINLANKQAADFSFMYWNDSESGWDYFWWCASGDGANFNCYRHSGSTGGWVSGYYNLSAYLGDPSVYIAFIFTSDLSNTYQGAFVDDVVVWGYDSGFNSNFNNSHTGWSVLKGKWKHASGKYYTTTGAANKWSSIVQSGNHYTFDYKVKMRRTGCTDCSNTIMVTGTPKTLLTNGRWKSAYLFNYTNTGYYSVWKVSGKNETALKNWTYSGKIKKGGVNTLRVVDKGAGLEFYINGTRVWYKKSETSLTGSKVGIGMFGGGVTGERLYVDSAILNSIYPRSLYSAFVKNGAELSLESNSIPEPSSNWGSINMSP